jgi:hypothetical protein
MTITLNGTTGISNDGGYTGDGVSFADDTPANTLVTTTDGDVGIGTSSPAYQLHISGSVPRIELTDTDTGADSYISADSSLGSLTFSADTNNEVAGSAMRFFVDGSESMRIDSSGRLSINGTSFVWSADEKLTIQAAANGAVAAFKALSGSTAMQIIFVGTGGSLAGYIEVQSTNTAYITSSDYRLKENITPMTGALAKVAQLKPVTYTWKEDGSDGQGFIAHELQEVVPECVRGEKDAVNEDGSIKPQGIDTSFLVATLTAAIQEQQATINELKARIETLESK